MGPPKRIPRPHQGFHFGGGTGLFILVGWESTSYRRLRCGPINSVQSMQLLGRKFSSTKQGRPQKFIIGSLKKTQVPLGTDTITYWNSQFFQNPIPIIPGVTWLRSWWHPNRFDERRGIICRMLDLIFAEEPSWSWLNSAEQRSLERQFFRLPIQ